MRQPLSTYAPKEYVKPVVFRCKVNNAILTAKIYEELKNPTAYDFRVRFGDGVDLEVSSSESGHWWVSDPKFNNHPQYEAKCLKGMSKDLPVIDFLITDNGEVLLSHVAFRGAMSIPTYVYIKSKVAADFYAGLFNECWGQAEKVTAET